MLKFYPCPMQSIYRYWRRTRLKVSVLIKLRDDTYTDSITSNESAVIMNSKEEM